MKRFLRYMAWIVPPFVGFWTIIGGVLAVWKPAWSLSFEWIIIASLGYFTLALLVATLSIALRSPDPNDVAEESTTKLLQGEDELYEALFVGPESVVESTTSEIIVTGSRSRDSAYLDAIVEKIKSPSIRHYRILFERSGKLSAELKRHLKTLLELSALDNRGAGDQRINVCWVPHSSDFPERFICASDDRAVISTQSSSQIDGFDTGILITDAAFVQALRSQLKNYRTLTGAREIKSLEELRTLS